MQNRSSLVRERRFGRLLTLAFVLGALGSALACEPIDRAVEPGTNPASGAIAVTLDDAELLIAAEDHNAVLVVDRLSHNPIASIPVPEGPSHILVLDDARAVVSTRYGNTVEVIDLTNNTVMRSIAVGTEPMGMTALNRQQIAVALAGEAAVAIVDVDGGSLQRKIALRNADPRAVALTNTGKLLVTHLTAGVLSEVDLTTNVVIVLPLATKNEFGPQTNPNQLRSLTLDPSGDHALIAHSQSNPDTVRAALGSGFDGMEPEMAPDGEVATIEFGDGSFGEDCGYSGCATQLGAVVPAITEIDVQTGGVLTPVAAPIDLTSNNSGLFGLFGDQAPMEGDCFDCGFDGFGAFVPNPPSFLNPFETRFGGIDLNTPTALAIADGGRGELVVNMGSKNLLMLRRHLRGTADDVIGVVQLGAGAQSIVLTHAGDQAYVWNQFDATVTEIEVPKFPEDDSSAQGSFASNRKASDPDSLMNAEFQPVPETRGVTFAVAEDVLPANVSEGRKLFFDATVSRISANHAISCGSCHPDGRSDGQTWQFTFGPRNTPQLGGGILDTAPFHWPGDVTDVRDLNNKTVLAFMGGTGMDPAGMDKIGAFIDTIRAAPAAVKLQGLTTEQLRGEALFYDDKVGCASCHAGNHMTDNISWDIGTKASAFDISRFQTPVLHGLARSRPYLHDGSEASLEQLVLDLVATNQMGNGGHLTDADLHALAEYLKTL